MWSIIGSANFDNRSLDMNDEVNIGIVDPAFAATLSATYEDDLRKAKRLTLEAWRERALHEKANEKFWSLLGEFF
jgi:cardiolipin synthase